MSLELDWLDPKFGRWLEILRYTNHLSKMNPAHLLVRVYKCESSLRVKGRAQDFKHILHYCNMEDCINLESPCDLEVAEPRLKCINRDKWWMEAHTKPKLRIFIEIHDTKEVQTIVKRNLPDHKGT